MTTATDLEWIADAACRSADGDTFFPEGPSAGWTASNPKSICARCPAAAVTACARTALEVNENYTVIGVWAGQYLGHATRSRQQALRDLRLIAGAEEALPPTVGRPQRAPAPCAGTCGRMVRPSGRALEEFPGTLSWKRKGMCVSCYRNAEMTELAATGGRP